MKTFSIKVANLVIKIESLFDYVYSISEDYLTNEDKHNFYIRSSNEAIENEKQYIENPSLLNRPELMESAAVLRMISEVLPNYDTILMHGAAISYKDKCYLFVAPSGTGKTTHINKWIKYLDDASIINGDKPFIRLINDKPYVFGTPWRGKEKYGNNTCLKLESIIILNRGNEDYIEKVNIFNCLEDIISKVYMPKNEESLSKTMDLINKLFKDVNVYKLFCTMNDSAFKVAYKGIIGEEYENKK